MDMQIEILATQIAFLCQAIKHIENGRTELAIERLEQGLDGCIIGLGNLQKRREIPDQIGQSLLIEALKAARIHRLRHPRDSKSKSGTADPEVQKIVQRILENIRE